MFSTVVGSWIPAFAGMTLGGCGSAGVSDPNTVSDHLTIVSLNPCADAILAEITVPGQLLAVSHYSQDPDATSMPLEDAMRFASTGGTVEEVLALDPDVVVADSFLAPATRQALEASGIQIVEVGIAFSLEDSFAQIEMLAELSGEPLLADVLEAEIGLAWAEHGADSPPVSTLLWQEGGIVAGEESLAFAMLEHAGFASHSAARGMGQGAYLPLEQVLADPPELILASGDERMLSHPVLREIEGVRYDAFDSSLLYCGGPTIPRALDRLAEIRRGIG